MTGATATGNRFVTLDIVRGVAVLGILAMNIAAFAMPDQAYLNPRAYGTESSVDLVSWAITFILVDGKMRGLFSFLFGASMLLVIQRAEATGQSAARVHVRRMLWLLLFGYLHFYFVWYGDILTGYATLGLAAWFVRDRPAETLLKWGALLTGAQFAVFAFFAMLFFQASAAASAPGAGPQAVAQWQGMSAAFAVPSPVALVDSLALFRGDYWGVTLDKLTNRTTEPLFMLGMFGWEVLANMLFGMALLKNGFFTGQWDRADYRRIIAIGFAIALPVFAILAAWLWWSGFAVPNIMLAMALAALVRPLMVVAIAAAVILASRRGNWLTTRIAAVGRAAFTNYLGTSLVMTGLFYGWGFGWFGFFSRAQLWLVVVPMWLVMLTWSKPWLEHFHYGPFEWLWRSLARWQVQPLRKLPSPAWRESEKA